MSPHTTHHTTASTLSGYCSLHTLVFSSQAAAAGGHLGLAWELRGSDLVLRQAGPRAEAGTEAEVAGYAGWKAGLNLGYFYQKYI